MTTANVPHTDVQPRTRGARAERPHWIKFDVNDEAFKAVNAAAARLGLSREEWVRRSAVAAAALDRIDPVAVPIGGTRTLLCRVTTADFNTINAAVAETGVSRAGWMRCVVWSAARTDL
ncbi:MAG: hypothetical protein F4Z29_07475 [Gemmatimonadetes bacterium]|nr:hypothetical protein [Gemmatimonadota bacterium]